MSKEKQIEEMARELFSILSNTMNGANFDDLNDAVYRILNLANYRKQSEGEWEIVKGSHGKEIMVCTNCRHSQDLHSTFTYCPNCGAKMKGGAE